ncbi:MAG: hypothetical protein GX595_16075 [Lentisphaerae bacterium]|nr:hypothetical protein [Lentisphaerota bacterium]
MRLRHSQPAAPAGRPFTLIELLTVMLIAGIMLAITVPVVVKITSGSSVEAASRMIGAQLRLARQEAIVKRRRVAILFPANEAVGVPEEARFLGFRACYVDDNDEWTAWVENTVWTYVPVGAVIAEVDDDNGIQWTGSAPQQPRDDTTKIVKNVDGTMANESRAVIFRPTGRVGLQFSVSIVEGAVIPSGGTATVQAKNRDNWIDVRANQYTGRVSFVRPGV